MNKENWFSLRIIDHSKELYINIGTIKNIYFLTHNAFMKIIKKNDIPDLFFKIEKKYKFHFKHIRMLFYGHHP